MFSKTLHTRSIIQRLFVRSPSQFFSSSCKFSSSSLDRSLKLTLVTLSKCISKPLFFQRGFFSTTRLSLGSSPLNVNTNIVKDVVLFRYENPSFYRMLNIFAVCQFLFWMYLSHFAYTSLKDTPINKENDDEQPWWRKINLGENKYRNGIAVMCFIIGYGILASAWAFTLKSVRFVILRKGGESVTLVTYGPYGKNRMTTVPLTQMSCQESRQAARVQLPIKVNGTYLYYVLDMRGEFTNPGLFDVTAGLSRKWNK